MAGKRGTTGDLGSSSGVRFPSLTAKSPARAASDVGSTSSSLRKTASPKYDNPFKMPTDEEVFALRDAERRRKEDEREAVKSLKVHEKTTSSYRHSSTRLDIDVDDDQDGVDSVEDGLGRLDFRRPGTEEAESRGSPTKARFRKTVSASASPSRSPQASRPHQPTNLANFVESKRSMFLLQYSLAVKREEMLRLDQTAQAREDALKRAEKMLDEDAARFDAFLKENNVKTMEATKRADQETKAKIDKVSELKKLTAQIGTIRNEMAKYDEMLEDCNKYKDFLDLLTPADWKEEVARQRESKKDQGRKQGDEQDDDTPMYFVHPQQLLDVFKALEESNMFLI
eukprot:TRINITY_DN13255_c0_g1_i1.p1 TRINITY_DN13255_c0_g1~~TRINITY_DN13255_c0_g1_i1.p1  ORF type:complete len:341 (+),score=79.96 TRINITY_DN13255_c0_g1_i1:2-1024(+)